MGGAERRLAGRALLAGYGSDTLEKLDALTFIPMADDPSALSEAERTAFNAFRLGDLCDEEDYLIKQDTLTKLIETLPSGVSPGPTGLRNEHLKEAACTGLGAQAVEGIIQLLARGELGAILCPRAMQLAKLPHDFGKFREFLQPPYS